jgi:hypothetical protein
MSICAVVGVALIPLGADAAPLRVVALSGVSVPDAEIPFDGFGAFSLNNSGQVAFNAWQFPNELRVDSGGVWIASPGEELMLVDPPRFGHYDLALNDAGEILFANGDALNRGGSLNSAEIVAAYGGIAPSVSPPNSTFTSFFYSSGARLNDRNQVAFQATAAGRARLYVGNSQESLTLIASGGQQLTEDGRNRSIQNLGGAQLSNDGDVLFTARVKDEFLGGEPDYYASYLWSQSEGVSRVAGSGDIVDTDRGPVDVATVVATINDHGRVAVLLNEETIAIRTNDGYKVIASEGDAIGNEQIFYFSNRYAMAASDTVVYEVAMIGGAAIPNQTRMIVKNAPGEQPEVVVRTMTRPPGAREGVVLASSINDFWVNSHGQVAFVAWLVDEATGDLRERGIWAEDHHGMLQMVAQTGDFVDVDNSSVVDLRQINYIREFNTGSNQNGAASNFNDRGQVAFVVAFTDGSNAILVSGANIPEPNAVSILLSTMAGTGLHFRLRRRATG